MSAAAEKAIRYAVRDLPTLKRATELAKGRTAAVQAGANLGIWPEWLSREFATVYSFEPDGALFQRFATHASAGNIVKIQAALGYERKLVAMSDVRENGKPSHPGVTHIVGPGVVPTLRIDDLALPECDLIALDLEGYELFALKGGQRTIARCRPVILVEINQNCLRFGVEADAVRGWLMRAGYALVCREHSDEIYVHQEAA